MADWMMWSAVGTISLAMVTVVALVFSYWQNKKSLKLSERTLQVMGVEKRPKFDSEHTTFQIHNGQVRILLHNCGGATAYVIFLKIRIPNKSGTIYKDVAINEIVRPGASFGRSMDVVLRFFDNDNNKEENISIRPGQKLGVAVDYIHAEDVERSNCMPYCDIIRGTCVLLDEKQYMVIE